MKAHIILTPVQGQSDNMNRGNLVMEQFGPTGISYKSYYIV